MDLTRGQKLLVVLGLATLVVGVGVMSLVRLAREQRQGAYVPLPEPLTKTAAAGSVAVHVTGAVLRPGLYWLPAGSRVSDAIAQAGGFLPAADQQSVNLAAPLEDGRQIRVTFAAGAAPAPTPSAPVAAATAPAPPPGPLSAPMPSPVTPPAAAPAPRAEPPPAVTYPLSLNLATAQQLETLPGIGPKLALRIVDYRTTHGGFRTVEELTEVRGIDTTRLATLRRYLTL